MLRHEMQDIWTFSPLPRILTKNLVLHKRMDPSSKNVT